VLPVIELSARAPADQCRDCRRRIGLVAAFNKQSKLVLSASKALECSKPVLAPVKLDLAGQVPSLGGSPSEIRVR
jgi:hypothetical protein